MTPSFLLATMMAKLRETKNLKNPFTSSGLRWVARWLSSCIIGFCLILLHSTTGMSGPSSAREAQQGSAQSVAQSSARNSLGIWWNSKLELASLSDLDKRMAKPFEDGPLEVRKFVPREERPEGYTLCDDIDLLGLTHPLVRSLPRCSSRWLTSPFRRAQKK
jgi:hypothetical protein